MDFITRAPVCHGSPRKRKTSWRHTLIAFKPLEPRLIHSIWQKLKFSNNFFFSFYFTLRLSLVIKERERKKELGGSTPNKRGSARNQERRDRYGIGGHTLVNTQKERKKPVPANRAGNVARTKTFFFFR